MMYLLKKNKLQLGIVGLAVLAWPASALAKCAMCEVFDPTFNVFFYQEDESPTDAQGETLVDGDALPEEGSVEEPAEEPRRAMVPS